MKELTIEEKAKAYDDLLVKLQKAKVDNNVCDERYCCVIDDIVPELKESEGEKWIPKEIAKYLKEKGGFRSCWIAWLEKQGEQKPAELSNTCEFSIKTWINIVAYVLKEHNGIGNYLDDPEVKDTAEKLQKRYKFDSASEEWDRVYRKGLDAGVNKGKAIALREKNHAWSEEDEAVLDALTRRLEGEDIHVSTHLAVKCLKSLKDRYTWKPSDKELGAILTVIGDERQEGSDVTKELLKVYHHLKKLREE